MEPLQRSSAGYTMTQADRQSLEMLREFYTHHGSGQMGPSKYLSTIHDLEPNSYVDIICRVRASFGRPPGRRGTLPAADRPSFFLSSILYFFLSFCF
jgi:hypothetical protein